MNNNNRIIGYDPQTGQPIYENNNIQSQPMMNNTQPINNNQQTYSNVQPQTNNNQPVYSNVQPPINNNQQIYSNVQPSIKNKKNNKLIISLIIVFIFIVLSIVGICYLVNNKLGNQDRTIMIYMVGSNLESQSGLGTVDLNSIDYNKMDNENINVVLIAGGSEDWYNDYISKDETSIYELTSDGYKKVKTQSIKNMGDSQVFSEYLDYVYENYKTDKYDLVFWNHGGAIIGSEFDDLSGDNLSLEEMELGLDNSKFNEKNKLELVMFRTCLNGTIEVADVFNEYAEYLVASEEVTLGSSRTSVLNFINNINTSDNGYDVGYKFIESYKNQIAQLKQAYGSEGIYSTYSIVDLSKIDNLTKSLNDFVRDINISEHYNTISRVRTNLYQYAQDDASYDMVDLYNLVDGLKDISKTKAEKVLKNIESAIVYNWATNDNSRGMSVYFPYNGSSKVRNMLLTLYNNFDSLSEYGNFISNFNSIKSGGVKNYSFNNNNINISNESEISQSYDFTLELTDEQLNGYAKAEYLVFLDKGDGYFWPVYKGLEVDLKGKTLNANINGKALKITDDDADYVFPLFETYNGDDFIKYTTSVILENFSAESPSDWKMDTATLTLVLDKSDNKIKVGSVVLNEKDENKPNSVAVNLKDYEYIAFGSMSHKLLDSNGNFSMEVYNENNNGIYEGVEITIDELSNFNLSSFDDNNNYYSVFRIYDVDNNVYYSKLIEMN